MPRPRKYRLDSKTALEALRKGLLSQDEYELIVDVEREGVEAAAKKRNTTASTVTKRLQKIVNRLSQGLEAQSERGEGRREELIKIDSKSIEEEAEERAKRRHEELMRQIEELRERLSAIKQELMKLKEPFRQVEELERRLNSLRGELEQLRGEPTLKDVVEALENEIGEVLKEIANMKLKGYEVVEKAKEVAREDVKYVQKLLSSVDEARRPILHQWITAHKNFNEILINLGIRSFLMWLMNRTNSVDESLELLKKYEEPDRLVRDFEEFFASLLHAKNEAIRIMELERELKVLKADYDFTLNAYSRLERAYLMAASIMCKSCREKFLLSLALKEVVGLS